MENFYTAYTKPINGVTFHFVKHFQTFPEYKDVPPLLENYGMHTNFYKACKIAGIQDKAIQKQLFETIYSSAEIIHMNRSKASIYMYRARQIGLPVLLNWMGLRKLLHVKQKIA